jgi:hypothetical protein
MVRLFSKYKILNVADSLTMATRPLKLYKFKYDKRLTDRGKCYE